MSGEIPKQSPEIDREIEEYEKLKEYVSTMLDEMKYNKPDRPEKTEQLIQLIKNIKQNIEKIGIGQQAEYTFEIPAVWGFIHQIRKTIFGNLNFKKEKVDDYNICLGEIINNVLEHGAKLGNPLDKKSDFEKIIKFAIEKTRSKLIIDITSPGEGFDYKKNQQEAKWFRKKRMGQMEKEKQENPSEDLSRLKKSGEEIDKILKNIKESEFHLGEEGGRGSIIRTFLNPDIVEYFDGGKIIRIKFDLEK